MQQWNPAPKIFRRFNILLQVFSRQVSPDIVSLREGPGRSRSSSRYRLICRYPLFQQDFTPIPASPLLFNCRRMLPSEDFLAAC